MAVVSMTGYAFGFNTKQNKKAGDIQEYLQSTHGISCQVNVGYDADGDGKADDVLIMIDPGDEAAFEAVLEDIKTFVKKTKTVVEEANTDELDLTVKKKYDKAGKEK